MGRKKICIDYNVLKVTYENSKSVEETAIKLNTTEHAVRARLIEYNIHMKSVGGQHLYECDDNFFSHDTPESFYWAGFIAADGCVRSGKKSGILLAIVIKDTGHLDKFKRIIGYSGPIHKYTIKDNYFRGRILKKSEFENITIHSSKIFNDLSRFNIVPRKTKVYFIPEWLENHHLVSHFLRGYVDGDGCWSEGGGGRRHSLILSCCGTKKCINSIVKIFSENCGTDGNKTIFFDNYIYNVYYSGNLQLIRLRDFLYKDSYELIYMDRKKKIAYNNWIDEIKHDTCRSVFFFLSI